MDDFSDLLGDTATDSTATPSGHGGYRVGAGKKSKAVQDATKDSHVEYTLSRAKKEKFQANMAEHNFNVESGKYVSREDVSNGAAVAFATVAQTLRSIPDNLERRFGLAPEVTEAVAIQIDEIMGDLSADLEKLHGANTPAPQGETSESA